jgi:hypothetical protein
MTKERKIFFVVATGGQDTDRHYFDTIKTKRTVEEAGRFLSQTETEALKKVTHDRSYAVWGGVPGTGNLRTWNNMEPGDYVMVYRGGKVILAAEVAMKVRNPELARHFWQEDRTSKTWELMYFLINDVEVNVPQSEVNKYLGYPTNYFPRGFMAIQQEKANHLLSAYGDLLSLLKKLEQGQKLEEVDVKKQKEFQEFVEEKKERAPTEHDEMQWRLISLGNKAHFGVWVPVNDQGREYEGNKFRDFVLPEFQEAIDVPTYVKNIDTVWKLGFSIKAAFEVEHSTSIYSGILRLSDLRALAPNSNYPLFIVAHRDRRNKVFEQLKRPTFSNDYLKLDREVKFFSYDKIRELDENYKEDSTSFDINWLITSAEPVI